MQGHGFIELWLDAAAMGEAGETAAGDLCTMLDEHLAAVGSEDMDSVPQDTPVAGDEAVPRETPDIGRKVQEVETVRETVRVLIASHSTLFSRALSGMISQAQHEVILTDNANDLISHLKKKDVDLCFVRDALPSGLDICAQFARQPGDGYPVPMIIYAPLSGVKSRALESGACGFLKVPCQPNEVLALVDRWGKTRQAVLKS